MTHGSVPGLALAALGSCDPQALVYHECACGSPSESAQPPSTRGLHLNSCLVAVALPLLLWPSPGALRVAASDRGPGDVAGAAMQRQIWAPQAERWLQLGGGGRG